MKPAVAKKTVQDFLNPNFETLQSQIAKPMLDEAVFELGGFFDKNKKRLSSRPKSLAHDDLARAREAQNIEQMGNQDSSETKEKVRKIQETIRHQYREHDRETQTEQHQMKKEFVQLQEEVAKLAKASGVDTKAHLENVPQQVSAIDIKRLSMIVKTLTIKAEESKSAKDLVSQRANAKPATGMMAWVSGKQMKIHEQGTMTLQG